LKVYVERYPGLLDLIEEFEHLSLAKEEPDPAAVTYFKRQKRLREEGFEVGGFKMEDVKVEITEAMGKVGGRIGARLDEDGMAMSPELEDVKNNHLSGGDEVKNTGVSETGGLKNRSIGWRESKTQDQPSFALNGSLS